MASGTEAGRIPRDCGEVSRARQPLFHGHEDLQPGISRGVCGAGKTDAPGGGAGWRDCGAGTGRPAELQRAAEPETPIYYIAFDCLHCKGKDLLGKPIEERKRHLKQIAQDFIAPMQPVFEFAPEVDLETATEVVRQTNIERLVAKRLGSKYYPGEETDLWLKQRFNQEDKFFIGGYIPGPRGMGELLIGEYRDGKLYHVKRLIAGLNQFNREEIFKAVQDLKSKRVPYVNLPETASQRQHAVTEEVMRQVQWIKPEQPVEVEFVERTPHGRLRHALFRRLLPRSGEK